jgi:hypothetical protein
LVVFDAEDVENINDSLGNLGLSAITDEYVHGTVFANVVHEGGRKLFVRGAQAFFATCESQLPPHKELGDNRAIVNGRNWSVDRISGNRFIVPRDVKSWIGGLTPMVKLGTLNSTEMA